MPCPSILLIDRIDIVNAMDEEIEDPDVYKEQIIINNPYNHLSCGIIWQRWSFAVDLRSAIAPPGQPGWLRDNQDGRTCR